MWSKLKRCQLKNLTWPDICQSLKFVPPPTLSPSIKRIWNQTQLSVRPPFMSIIIDTGQKFPTGIVNQNSSQMKRLMENFYLRNPQIDNNWYHFVFCTVTERWIGIILYFVFWILYFHREIDWYHFVLSVSHREGSSHQNIGAPPVSNITVIIIIVTIIITIVIIIKL